VLKAKSLTVHYIADLYRKGFGKLTAEQEQQQPKKKKPKKDTSSCVVGEQHDDFLTTLLEDMKEKNVINDSDIDDVNSDGEETEVVKEARFLTMIEVELEDYMFCCSQVNWADLCELFPTDKYSNNGEPINYDLIMKTKDPQYTATLFDVLAWYKTIERPRFGQIASAASIRLGKPN
jgi:hypothetical protein